MPMYRSLHAERIKDLLDYDPITGLFTWRVNRSRGVRAGEVAGCDNGRGYWRICIDDVRVKAHILAWFWIYGAWPTLQIDHRNGDKYDNRIANLREATPQQNKQNTHRANRNNRCGFLGVSRQGRRWHAVIYVDATPIRLGTFDTPEEASAAYQAAKRELHPFLD